MPEKYSTWLTQWNVLQNHDYLWTYQVWSGSIHPSFWIKEIFCLDSFSYCSFPEIHSFHKSTWQNRHIHKNYRHTYEISGLQSPFVEENLGLWSCRTWIVCFSQNIGIRSGQIFFYRSWRDNMVVANDRGTSLTVRGESLLGQSEGGWILSCGT